MQILIVSEILLLFWASQWIQNVLGVENMEMLQLFEGILQESMISPRRHALRSLASSSSTANPGFAYYNFFSSNDCSGSLTYQTGVRANTCLPASAFGIPYNDSLIPTFKSFFVSNLNENCENSYISFYSNQNCSHQISSSSLQKFQTCQSTNNLHVNVLKSARGYCSVGHTLPIASSSYVLSEYLATTAQDRAAAAECNSTAVTSFNAYPVNVCYGDSNYTSTSYACSSVSGPITMNRYYGSNLCPSSDDVGETSLSLSLNCSLKSNFTDSLGYIRNTCALVSDSSSSDSSTSLSTGAIAGIVVGGVVVVVAVALLIASMVCGVSFGSLCGKSFATKKSTASFGNEMNKNPMAPEADYNK